MGGCCSSASDVTEVAPQDVPQRGRRPNTNATASEATKPTRTLKKAKHNAGGISVRDKNTRSKDGLAFTALVDVNEGNALPPCGNSPHGSDTHSGSNGCTPTRTTTAAMSHPSCTPVPSAVIADHSTGGSHDGAMADPVPASAFTQASVKATSLPLPRANTLQPIASVNNCSVAERNIGPLSDVFLISESSSSSCSRIVDRDALSASFVEVSQPTQSFRVNNNGHHHNGTFSNGNNPHNNNNNHERTYSEFDVTSERDLTMDRTHRRRRTRSDITAKATNNNNNNNNNNNGGSGYGDVKGSSSTNIMNGGGSGDRNRLQHLLVVEAEARASLAQMYAYQHRRGLLRFMKEQYIEQRVAMLRDHQAERTAYCVQWLQARERAERESIAREWWTERATMALRANLPMRLEPVYHHSTATRTSGSANASAPFTAVTAATSTEASECAKRDDSVVHVNSHTQAEEWSSSEEGEEDSLHPRSPSVRFATGTSAATSSTLALSSAPAGEAAASPKAFSAPCPSRRGLLDDAHASASSSSPPASFMRGSGNGASTPAPQPFGGGRQMSSAQLALRDRMSSRGRKLSTQTSDSL